LDTPLSYTPAAAGLLEVETMVGRLLFRESENGIDMLVFSQGRG